MAVNPKTPSVSERIVRKSKEFWPIKQLLRSLSDSYESKRDPHNLILTPPALLGWSFVIITNGKNIESLDTLVSSIQRELQGQPYEILLVGPSSLAHQYTDPSVHILPYKELNIISGWITRKKNLGVEAARYENVVICHDYLVLGEGWKKGFDAFGNNFNVCTNVVLNLDGSRHRDWITLDYPGIGAGLLPYHVDCSQYQYISGAYMVVKRNFYLAHPLDEKLRWGEGEDVEWSKDVRRYTKFSFNPYSTVTYSKQKSGIYGDWAENTKKLQELFSKTKHA